MGRPTISANQRLGQLLRAARERAGLRQVDVAERLRQSQSFVSRFESGEQRLDLFELQTVCRVLGVKFLDVVKQFEERT